MGLRASGSEPRRVPAYPHIGVISQSAIGARDREEAHLDPRIRSLGALEALQLRAWGLGFWVLGFGVWGFGVGVLGLTWGCITYRVK